MMKPLSLFFLLSALSALQAAPVRVACVGDSITEGTVLKNRKTDSYPAVLARLLGPGFVVENFGCSGATVTFEGEGAKPYMRQPVFEAAKAFSPDLVVVMLGTNDTKTAVFDAGASTFRDRYQELLDSFRSLPGRPSILICLPPPVMGEGRFTINEPNRQKLLPQISSLAQTNELKVVDFATLLSSRPEWFPDLVHPNAEATGAMADEIARQISKP